MNRKPPESTSLAGLSYAEPHVDASSRGNVFRPQSRLLFGQYWNSGSNWNRFSNWHRRGIMFLRCQENATIAWCQSSMSARGYRVALCRTGLDLWDHKNVLVGDLTKGLGSQSRTILSEANRQEAPWHTRTREYESDIAQALHMRRVA